MWMCGGVQVKGSRHYASPSAKKWTTNKRNDSAMMQHWAMYTGKRIIPQNIYIYKIIYIMQKFWLIYFFFLMNRWGGWLGLGFKNQPFLNHLSIFTQIKVPQLYIIIKKKKKKKHSDKNITFEIIISTSVSDKSLVTPVYKVA